jgi:hypothetical protein
VAFTLTRGVVQPVTSQTINTTATYTSAEVDIGDDTIAEQAWLYADVAGYAAAPAGNKLLTVSIQPVHTTSGTAYADACPKYYFPVAADQAYAFAAQLTGLPRYFKVVVLNDTNQNTDDSAVNVRIEYNAVTS